MEIQDRENLVRFAREHHVHYEVEPEAAAGGVQRERIGLEVKLFATHGESKLEAPGCPKCVELLGELQSFAERLVSSGEAASRAEIIPVTPALYQSTEVEGADEVAVAVRLPAEPNAEGRAGAREDRLRAMRERLKEVGVPQR